MARLVRERNTSVAERIIANRSKRIAEARSPRAVMAALWTTFVEIQVQNGYFDLLKSSEILEGLPSFNKNLAKAAEERRSVRIASVRGNKGSCEPDEVLFNAASRADIEPVLTMFPANTSTALNLGTGAVDSTFCVRDYGSWVEVDGLWRPVSAGLTAV
ncbi:hypothetical protein KA075_01290 [Candidatus Saccharibacteria bacterium]|jgi:hypothetical protein|nr:hypothetical protein [Candidatus Saccharibacteria bacterium]